MESPGTDHLSTLPCLNTNLHHWHLLVNLGKYSTSLSLTASLYPLRKLKIADWFLHLHQPFNHHHLFIFQSDCRRQSMKEDSGQKTVTGSLFVPNCQVWKEESLSEPYFHVHQFWGARPPTSISGGSSPFPLHMGVKQNEKETGSQEWDQCFVLGEG